MERKLYVLISLIGFQVGCASIAHNPYACESVSERLAFYSWPYKLFGNITQVGDCAASKTLKIETGDYYSYNKAAIDHEVEMKFSENEGFELNHFAKALSCEPNAYAKFHSAVTIKKEEIFGQNYERSPRSVTKSIREIIDKDDDLSRDCR